jgi:hypothetical protein
MSARPERREFVKIHDEPTTEGPSEFEVWCDGELVAGSSGPRSIAYREALNYFNGYIQEGHCELCEVKRTVVLIAGRAKAGGKDG